MKISLRTFKGMAPRVSPRILPEDFSQNALNCRLLTGDLQGWQQMKVKYDLAKTAVINTIYLMARHYWLHWNDSEIAADAVCVDVARGLVQGDTTERTYFTGTDAPRVTNLELATTNPGVGVVAGAYPYNSYLMGVPAPEVDPTIVVLPTGSVVNSIVLTNPGAEFGNTGGWITESGDLAIHASGDVVGFDAQEGTQYFYGGNVASTVAYQSLDINAEGLIESQTITLNWYQASGANNSTATMGVRFYDASLVLISEFYQPEVAISPALEWQPRSVSSVIPLGTRYIYLVQKYTRVGGGELDGYIDNISFTYGSASYVFDGSRGFDGLEVDESPGNDVGEGIFTNEPLVGRPPPAYRYQSDNSNNNSLFLDVAFSRSPQIDIAFDYLDTDGGVGPRVDMNVGLGASSTGEADVIWFHKQAGIKLNHHLSFQSAPAEGDPSATLIAAGDLHHVVYSVVMTCVRIGAGKFTVAVTATNKSNGAVIASGSTEINTLGDIVYFKGINPVGTSTSGVLDNISITVATPDTPDTSSEIELTNYVYTFVNVFGEESAPSNPSRTIQRTDNTSVQIFTAVAAPAGYGIEKKRIYRAVTGPTSTDYFLVAEEALVDPDYTDNLRDQDLGEILESLLYDLPPTDMRGILALPNGIMMGFSKNDVCPSAQFRPHAYPVDYRLSTDSTIVGIAAIDTTVVVATESYPYLVIGSDPSALSMSKLEAPFACVSKRSIVTMMGYGVVYASQDGLVAINGASVKLITDKYFTKHDWLLLCPETIHAIVHDDRYFGFYSKPLGVNGGFIFDPKPDGFGLVMLDFYPTALFVDRLRDRLYFVLTDGNIWCWDNECEEIRPYRWRSKLFQTPYPTNLTSAEVKARDYDNLTFRLYGDGVLVHETPVLSQEEFVLPAVEAKEWEIEIAGTSRVTQVECSDDMGELA